MISDAMKLKRAEIRKAVKKETNRQAYEKRKEQKVICEVCAAEFDKYWEKKHFESNRHRKIMSLNYLKNVPLEENWDGH
jgi:hypothetical protein